MKSKRRYDAFIEQCSTCVHDQCIGSCKDCAMYCGTINTKHDCYCCCNVEDDETSCKYYKEKDDETIVVGDAGTKQCTDVMKTTDNDDVLVYKSLSSTITDTAEKLLHDTYGALKIPPYDPPTLKTTAVNRVDELERQVNELKRKLESIENENLLCRIAFLEKCCDDQKTQIELQTMLIKTLLSRFGLTNEEPKL